MVPRALLAAATLLALIAVAAATAGCTTQVDSSSWMSGAKWLSSFQLYTQETTFKIKGDMTKVNLYYDQEEGCVRGVKPTYGYDAANALRLGTEGDGTKAYFTNDLKLQAGEYFVKAEHRFNASCITFLKLSTNKNRQIMIGNCQSTAPLVPSAPSGTVQSSAGTSSVRFLGFFKGYTDVPNTSAKVGKLQQLQFVWVVRSCPLGDVPSPTPAQPSPPVVVVPTPSPVVTPPPVIIKPSPTPAPAPTPTVGCKPSAAMGCANGKCPTDTCALSGLGMDVLKMICYGVNVTPQPLLGATIGYACHNLACKLDRQNCTSVGLLGLGGYCTGKIVAINAASTLHPTGQALLGYPCIEHTGPVLDLLPVISNTQKGMYMSKAWKACNCNAGLPKVAGLNVSLDMALPFISQIPDKTTTLLTNLFKVGAANASSVDAIAQWVAASAAKMPLPKLAINATSLGALKMFIPGFHVPAIMVPNISFPLFKAPADLKLPVFKLPDAAMAQVSKLLPLSTLASLVIPDNITVIVPDLAAMLPDLDIPKVTLVGLFDMAETFVDKLPDLPSINLANIQKYNMSDVVVEWVGAVRSTAKLPIMTVGDVKLNALKALIPGLVHPSIIIPNISFPLFSKPATLNVPVFKIPSGTVASVALLLPGLKSLPTILTKSGVALPVNLPGLTLPAVSISGLLQLANSMGLQAAQASASASSTAVATIDSMGLKDVVAQWLAAHDLGLPLPKMIISNMTANAIKALIPGLTLPSVLLADFGTALLNPAANLSLPLFTIPSAQLSSMKQLLANLTSLPTIITTLETAVETAVPSIRLLTIPNLKALAASLGVVSSFNGTLPNIIIPTLPSIPSLEALLRVNATSLASFVTLLSSGNSLPLLEPLKLVTSVANLTTSAWQQLGSSIDSVIDAVIPSTASGAAGINLGSMGNVAGIVAGEFDAILNNLNNLKISAPTTATPSVAAQTADASTAYISADDWASLSEEDKNAMLALVKQ
uniref:Jacalin-type lectin domain-containing protein n=1 Tax=Tetradesmus obliquus TaxID=3088 RepID=A0A383V8S0_TETOB|eukprot:jgi/Sobl393_1/3376/SZX61967.1